MTKPKKPSKKYEKKLSLYPMTIEEALKKALETKPPEKDKTKKDE